jgi:glyoxylase-like metal-dependent hydrolase (beta-lactamase superfamily II)
MGRPQLDLCDGFESDTVRCLNLGATTAYLVQGVDGYLLVDTGSPRDYDDFRAVLSRLGVGLDEIKVLVLTHGHDDHAGFTARFLEENGARLVVHRAALPLLRGRQLTPEGLTFLNGRVFLMVMLYALVAQRDFAYPPVTLREGDVVLGGDDDQVLRDLGFEAEIIATPGHTPDSISVVTTDGRVCCGDAAMNFLTVSGAHHRPIFLSDREAVFASWRKMLDCGARVIYPAHGAPFAAESLAAALRRFDRQTES